MTVTINIKDSKVDEFYRTAQENDWLDDSLESDGVPLGYAVPQ